MANRSPVAAEKASHSSEKDAAGAVGNPTLAARLDYRARGWHTFPAPVGEKKSHKSQEYCGALWGATFDPEEIRRDFAKWPHANIGIRTGKVSGIFVLDADTIEGHGVDGLAALRALTDQHGALPRTVEAVSPSGSRHFYFRWPDVGEVWCSESVVGPGIDIRGNGGMVITPPSVKPDGCQYQWVNPPSSCEVADAPAWLLALVRAPRSKKSRTSATVAPTMPVADVVACLRHITPNTGYHQWLDTLMAIHSATGGSTEGLGLAEWWSSCGSEYEPDLVEYKWPAFDPNGGIDAWALLKMARDPETDPEADFWDLHAADADPEWKWGEPVDLDAIEARLRHRSIMLEFGEGEGLGEPVGGSADSDTSSSVLEDMTERDLALEFSSLFPNVRFDHTIGKWFFCRDHRWRVDDTGIVLNTLLSLARGAARGMKAAERRKAGSSSFARGAASCASVLTALATTSAIWDADPMILGTPDGVVDLRTGKLRPAVPGDYVTKITGCSPANGTPTRWLRFLEEATGGDADTIKFLQRWAGYCLSGVTTEHVFVFIHGGGGDGKSVLVEVLAHALGDYAQTAAVDTFTASKLDRHTTDVASLAGARLVVASETEQGRAWNEARIKVLTGGDKMTARFMNKDNFTYIPQLKLMVVGNHQPRLGSVDDSMRRRMRVIPFSRKPAAPDPHLLDTLKAEAPAILQWMIEGCLQWQAEGLGTSETIRATSDDYFESQDVFGDWLNERCVIHPTAIAASNALFASWKQFAEGRGETCGSGNTLAAELKKRGFKSGRRRIDSKMERAWRGIGLEASASLIDDHDHHEDEDAVGGSDIFAEVEAMLH